MSRLATLGTLLAHETRLRDEALATRQHALLSLQQAQAQVQQLDEYRLSYHERWSGRGGQPLSAEVMRCARGFAQRLDEAIAQQTTAADQARARDAEAQERLLRCERRVASVQRLIERLSRQWVRAQDRRDQKALDELAQRPRLAAHGRPLVSPEPGD